MNCDVWWIWNLKHESLKQSSNNLRSETSWDSLGMREKALRLCVRSSYKQLEFNRSVDSPDGSDLLTTVLAKGVEQRNIRSYWLEYTYFNSRKNIKYEQNCDIFGSYVNILKIVLSLKITIFLSRQAHITSNILSASLSFC